MREIENVLERVYIMESGCILEQNNFSKRQHMDYSARQLMENGIEPPLSEANQIAMDQF